jgi:GNAT superfamily N-acetyltransferase
MRKIALHIASDADLPALAALRWRLKMGDSASLHGEDFDLFVGAFIRTESAALARGDVVHWIADIDGAPAAAMSVVAVRKVTSVKCEERRWGYLTNCYVSAEHRNAGVGSRLLAAIQSWAKNEAFEFIIVWPSDRAFSFYERSGFQPPTDALVWAPLLGD